MVKIFVFAVSADKFRDGWLVPASICYPHVASILIPIYKRIGCRYHTIHTCEYPLPTKN